MSNEEAKDLLDNLIGMVEDNQNNDYDKALKLGIEALEKQIPKEPKCYEDKFIHCPSCGIGFGYKWECYPTKVNDYSHIKYCYGCGQMIDWSEIEE